MLDFIRVAAAVPEVSVGNVEENVKRIIEKAEDAEKDKPQLLVFPELSLTGYTCGDLFFQQSLLAAARDGLKRLLSYSQRSETILAVGLPLEIRGRLFNCAAVLSGGQIY